MSEFKHERWWFVSFVRVSPSGNQTIESTVMQSIHPFREIEWWNANERTSTRYRTIGYQPITDDEASMHPDYMTAIAHALPGVTK